MCVAFPPLACLSAWPLCVSVWRFAGSLVMLHTISLTRLGLIGQITVLKNTLPFPMDLVMARYPGASPKNPAHSSYALTINKYVPCMLGNPLPFFGEAPARVHRCFVLPCRVPVYGGGVVKHAGFSDLEAPECTVGPPSAPHQTLLMPAVLQDHQEPEPETWDCKRRGVPFATKSASPCPGQMRPLVTITSLTIFRDCTLIPAETRGGSS